MSDYKVLKEAYLDNTTEYVRENFNVRTTPAPDNELGTLLLSNSNTKALYRVIRADPTDSSLYEIAVKFERLDSNDVTVDIKNVFKELCLFPSSSFGGTPYVTERDYGVSLQQGDTVTFNDPGRYGRILQGGMYNGKVQVAFPLRRGQRNPPMVEKHSITHNGTDYKVNILDPITITKYNPMTCNTIDRNRISGNANEKKLTYTYKKVPLARLIPRQV
jgi:hypothetical protein